VLVLQCCDDVHVLQAISAFVHELWTWVLQEPGAHEFVFLQHWPVVEPETTVPLGSVPLMQTAPESVHRQVRFVLSPLGKLGEAPLLQGCPSFWSVNVAQVLFATQVLVPVSQCSEEVHVLQEISALVHESWTWVLQECAAHTLVFLQQWPRAAPETTDPFGSAPLMQTAPETAHWQVRYVPSPRGQSGFAGPLLHGCPFCRSV
jgi:hypothetical protein